MKHLIFLAVLFASAICAAQDFDFPAAPVNDDAALSAAMPRLARDVLVVYRDDDRAKYLDTLFRLQWVAGEYANAVWTLDSLRALPADSMPPQARAAALLYEVSAKAKVGQGMDQSIFDATLHRSLRESLDSLNVRASAMAVRALHAEDEDSK